MSHKINALGYYFPALGYYFPLEHLANIAMLILKIKRHDTFIRFNVDIFWPTKWRFTMITHWR